MIALWGWDGPVAHGTVGQGMLGMPASGVTSCLVSLPVQLPPGFHPRKMGQVLGTLLCTWETPIVSTPGFDMTLL